MTGVTLTHSGTSLSVGDYSVYNNNWGTPSDYLDTAEANSSISAVDASSLNNNLTINWTFPNLTSPSNVWGYPEVYWGGRYDRQIPALSTQLLNIKSLNVTYSVNDSSSSSNSDVMLEVWTVNGSGQITNEIAVIVYGWGNGSGSTYTDSHITAIENTNTPGGGGGQATWNFVTLRTKTDMLQGTISFSDIITDLINKGVVNKYDYISGLELGAEMSGGSGQLQVNYFNVYESLVSTHTITDLGTQANDVFDITTNNDYDINGGGGVNTVRLQFPNDDIRMSTDNSGHILLSGVLCGSIDLVNIQRIKFADKTIALDVTSEGNAGKALEFIGMLAFNKVTDKATVGEIISYFDQVPSMHDISQLAVNGGLTRALAGGDSSNSALAQLVFRNVVGHEASAADVDSLVSYMDGRNDHMSQADFLTSIAGLQLNQNHVNLVGLQTTGVEYTPYHG